VLAGLRAWLEQTAGDVDVVITAASWADLLDHSAYPVDVVLLDLDLQDNIPVTLKLATLRAAGVAVVIVSTLADAPHVRACVAAGALGYVPKSDSAEEIVRAVRAAAIGEVYMTPTLAEMLISDKHQSAGEAATAPRLSPQELRALVLYASGMPMKSVARRLGVSFDTAKGYVDRVRVKYAQAGREARTKIELHGRAVEDGLLGGELSSPGGGGLSVFAGVPTTRPTPPGIDWRLT